MTPTAPNATPPEINKLSLSLAEKLAGTVINDIYQSAKGVVATKIKLWQNKATQKTMAKKLLDLRLVKTVWQIEKAVDLHDFYYRSTLQFPTNPRVVATSLQVLPTNSPLVIQGTIGQGKSILLRYLACREFEQAKRIPTLIELRRVTGGNILSYVTEELKSMGFKVDHGVIEHLFDGGHLVLLLDGFDEVAPENRASLIDILEHISRRYPKTQIVVSSRPDSAIQHSHLFTVVRLAPLGAAEHEALIYKLAPDEKSAKHIIDAVRNNKHVSNLLSTPLMVALLVLKYRATQSVPEHEAAFFSQLFEMLLQRHDRTKPGFIRHRQSKLSDVEMELSFDALSFLTRKTGRVQFQKQDMLAHVTKALELAPAKASASAYLADLIDITCLILEEAGDCRFVHKSVQEYHAARWIRRRTDDLAKNFYVAMRTQSKLWDQELRFLAFIDKYRFSKWFFVPAASTILGVDENVSPTWTPSKTRVRTILSDMGIAVSVSADNDITTVWEGTNIWILKFSGYSFTDFAHELANIKFGDLRNIPKQELPANLRHIESAEGDDITISLSAVVAHNPKASEPLLGVAQRWVKQLFAVFLDHRSYVQQQEQIANTFDF